MYTKELLIKELDILPQSAINAVYQFVEFQKYLMDDTTYNKINKTRSIFKNKK